MGDGTTKITNNYEGDNNEIVRQQSNLGIGTKYKIEQAYKKRECGYNLGTNNCQHSSRDAFNAATKSR